MGAWTAPESEAPEAGTANGNTWLSHFERWRRRELFRVKVRLRLGWEEYLNDLKGRRRLQAGERRSDAASASISGMVETREEKIRSGCADEGPAKGAASVVEYDGDQQDGSWST
ncbi:hypothetical protein DL769_002355 [Monosporascus sp. CRB-8-3]|nr:hypothetical protein DL769_002355 [Monosporascus sp. CRB-8-3]